MEKVYRHSSKINIFWGGVLCFIGFGIGLFFYLFGQVFLERGSGYWVLIVFALFLSLVAFLCGLNLIVYRKNFSITITEKDILIGNGVETWKFQKEALVDVFLSPEDLVIKSDKQRVQIPYNNYFQSKQEAIELVEEFKAEIDKRRNGGESS